MIILDLLADKEKLSLINNKINRERKSSRKLLKECNDKLFKERYLKHQESKYIKVGDW